MPSDKQPSRTAEHRRSNKPIMEKKRRARINNCLNELKNLLLEAMRKDPARHSKLEKADILEMTVKHLQNLQRQQMALQVAADPGVITKYRAGFNECAQEVSRYMGSLDNIGSPVKQRLLDHLANCMNGLGASVPTSGSSSFLRNNANEGDNGAPFAGPMQLIPSRLPNGEIALLLPSQSMANWPLNKQRFVSIYNNKNNGTPSMVPSMATECEPGSRSTLLTVNVGYNTRSSPSPNFGEESPVPNAHYRHSRCDSRSSLSPAMSDYSDTCSKYQDNPCSSDLSNAGSHFEPEVTWPKNTFSAMSAERSVMGFRSAEPNAFGMGTCSSPSPSSSIGRLTPCGGNAVRRPNKRPNDEPELLVPVDLSKDADKMWRPW